ncbi:hypothetical protein KC950_01815 [Candidatus Saccharibacteria bacterium]|nr:hypothetical protein [Candidatus Saccharibacteria bacterium]
MNADVKDIKKIALKLVNFLKGKAVFIFVIIGLSILGYLIFQINGYSTKEPSDDLLAEKLGESRPSRIDEDSVETIKNLQDVNVEVKAFFEQGRTNPFQD